VKLWGFDFEVQYKPEKENIVMDALSHNFNMVISSAEPGWLRQIKSNIKSYFHWHPIYE